VAGNAGCEGRVRVGFIGFFHVDRVNTALRESGIRSSTDRPSQFYYAFDS
jgi:hypothetical protein